MIHLEHDKDAITRTPSNRKTANSILKGAHCAVTQSIGQLSLKPGDERLRKKAGGGSGRIKIWLV